MSDLARLREIAEAQDAYGKWNTAPAWNRYYAAKRAQQRPTLARAVGLAALLLLLATPASGVPHSPEPFIPGGSPCDGACSQEWASEAASVPPGELRPMALEPGDLIHWMSYAKDGEAFYQTKPMHVATSIPLSGVGYTFERNGVTLIFMKLDACDNWTVAQRNPIPAPLDLPETEPESITGPLLARWTTPLVGTGSIAALMLHTGPVYEIVSEDRPAPSIDDWSKPLTHIPGPWSIFCLMGAITGLMVLKRKAA